MCLPRHGLIGTSASHLPQTTIAAVNRGRHPTSPPLARPCATSSRKAGRTAGASGRRCDSRGLYPARRDLLPLPRSGGSKLRPPEMPTPSISIYPSRALGEFSANSSKAAQVFNELTCGPIAPSHPEHGVHDAREFGLDVLG